MKKIVLAAGLVSCALGAALGQTQLILNGGFESGNTGAWQLSGPDAYIAYGPSYAHSGSYFLSLGGADPGALQTAYQTITIPPNAVAATLSYYYQVYSQAANANDQFQAIITNISSGGLPALVDYETGADSGGGRGAAYYLPMTYALSTNLLTLWAGQTVEVMFQAYVTGTTYFYIDDVSLFVETTADIPPNDYFTNRTVITGAAASLVCTNTFATKEPGEPNHAGNSGGHSLWWAWTAPTNGMLTLSTFSTSFISLLAAYTGPSVSNLTKVAAAMANSLTGIAQVTFPVVAGRQYQLAIDGYDGAYGTVVLNLAFSTDTQPPTLSISSPKSGQAVSNVLFTATGTARDNVGVASVFYQLNGGLWTLASTTNADTNWTATLTLIPGSNSFSAYAVDTSGNPSTTNKVPFKFIPSATLVLLTNGNGTVTPNLNGKLLALGANYTLKAAPTGNNLFSNWVGGITLPYTVLSASNSYIFTMQSNLVLQANFVSNPFIPQQGTFNGLFLDTNDVTEASSGFFTLTLTTSGAFTGKILTSGNSYTLPTTTPFDVSGHAQFTVPTTKPATLIFNLQLDLSEPASQQITGTVSNGAWTAELTADRAVFNANTNKALNFQGQYTLAIAGNENAAASPGGIGWATLSISPAGLISLAGNLADGTAMSQSVSVSKDGRWPFYTAYALPPSGNGGAVFGWLTFSNRPASDLGGALYWFRPAGKAPAFYQSGFTNLAVPVMGSAYNPTNKPLLALTNGQVTLEDGNLPFIITNQITLAPNDSITLTKAAENTNKLALTITKTTGAITGAFANPSNPKQTRNINGVLLQNLTNAAGYFLGTNQSGAFLLEKP